MSRLHLHSKDLTELHENRTQSQEDTDHSVQFHQVTPWANMHWGRHSHSREISVRTDEVQPVMLLSFGLEGGWRDRHSGWKGDFERQSGEMSLIHGQSLKSHSALPCSSSTHLTLAIQPEGVLRHFADDRSTGVSRMMKLARGEGSPQVTLPLSVGARNAVEQIRQCRHDGAMRSLMLEGRFYDLLLEFIQALDSTGPDCGKCWARLLRADEDRIREAALLMHSRMENPPSIAELSQLSGLSETKLKRGFQQVFGTTIFGHLRTQRMERAKHLLESGESSVLEASTIVGYSNPSHFTAAFRQQFGINPKKFQLTASGRKEDAEG